MDYQVALTFCLEDEISASYEDYTTLQDDDATALMVYQELNVCNFNGVQDETCKDNERSSDENIVDKVEDAETKTDCCEHGNENDHGSNDKQLVADTDLKRTENTSGIKADSTAEACEEKLNQIKDAQRHAKYDSSAELSESYANLRGIARRIDIEDPGESKEFNPRPPNFLPLEPDPEAEKDLKHQMMDDRKNAEDWMVDFALRRAVSKLAPARKRKVALLVEAFETVMPTSKWEPHLRQNAAGFSHPRPIQACRRCQFKVDISGEQLLYKLSLSTKKTQEDKIHFWEQTRKS